MPTVPVFGNRVEGCPYVIRPSAYVLLRNASGEIAIVRTAEGVFLPGGGIEAGETSEQAVVREAMEECGFVLQGCRSFADAIEIVYSVAENACFEKRSTFFTADLREITLAQDPGHDLLWLQPEAAMDMLSHGSHRWVIDQFGRENSPSGT